MVTKNGVLTTTIPSNADLIIGQTVPLMVTLTTNGAINTQNVNITFTGASPNISVPAGNLTLKDMGNNAYVYITELTVSNDLNVIKEHDPIQFTITVNGLNADPFVFTGTARTINPDTLPLMLHDVFLDTPNINPTQPAKGAQVTTLLLDKENSPLRNTPVFIMAKVPDNLSYCKILDSDNKTEIPIQKIGDYSGVSVNSDKDGNIKFYIYPQKADSMVLELQSWIVNVDQPVPASSPLFIVNTEIPNALDTMPEPNILGAFAQPLIAQGGESNFHVGVFKYPNAKKGDYILFFTQEENNKKVGRKYIGHYVTVKDPNIELGLGKYYYSLPYDIFEISIPYNFNCVAILGQGAGSITSSLTTVTYMGGATYSPDKTIKRDYDPCNVYTSLGLIPSNTPIPQGITLGYDSIKKYLYNHPKDPNTPVTGLFVEIVGDNNSQGKVPLGAKVTLNMYIQAANRNTQKAVGQDIMPITKNQETGRYSLIFHIEKKHLVNIFGGAESIWFDYEVGYGSDIKYGKIWAGGIDTRSEYPTEDEGDDGDDN